MNEHELLYTPMDLSENEIGPPNIGSLTGIEGIDLQTLTLQPGRIVPQKRFLWNLIDLISI